jgi:amylosucrase
VLTDSDSGVLATVRAHPSGPLVGLYNVTATPRPFPLRRLHDAGVAAPYDALGGHAVTAGADGVVWLPPYAAWWVVDRPVASGT